MAGSISVSEALAVTTGGGQSNNPLLTMPDDPDAKLMPDRFHIGVTISLNPAGASGTGWCRWALLRAKAAVYPVITGTTLTLSGKSKEEFILLKMGKTASVQNILISSLLVWEIDVKTRRGLEQKDVIGLAFLAVGNDIEVTYDATIFWE